VKLKEAGDIEIVLTILAVTLLVILAPLFLMLMLGGLVDAVRRAFVWQRAQQPDASSGLGLYLTETTGTELSIL
jgi:hypothetical protein